MRALIVNYDAYHTPLHALIEALPRGVESTVLTIALGGDPTDAAAPAPAGVASVEIDGRGRFADQYLTRAIKSNARYDRNYHLSSALSRPLMAEITAEQAAIFSIDTVVHGYAGNDALRFVGGLRTLAPDLQVVSARELCGSRTVANGDGYTVSSNIWGDSIESGPLVDPAQPPPPEVWGAGDTTAVERVEITFSRGVPVALNGEALPLADLIAALTQAGRRCGAGRADVVENGCVGLKTRAVYDAPAAAALIAAHEDLEQFVCSRREIRFKRLADAEWADLVYDGLWFDPARASLDRYIHAVNERVTGTVTIELGRGGIRALARQSAAGLYDDRHAIYRAGQEFGTLLIPELAEQNSIAARLWYAGAR